MPQTRLDRREILKGAGAITGATALVAVQAITTVHAQEDEHHPRNSVLGTWLERVIPNAFPGFDVLITFDAGGGLIASSSGDLTPGTLSGPVHGVWVRTGNRSFSWFGLAFAFDAQGQPQGIDHIRKNFTLDARGDTYTGSGSFERIFNGRVLFSGTETLKGTRVTA
jgi:hypothetical protein